MLRVMGHLQNPTKTHSVKCTNQMHHRCTKIRSAKAPGGTTRGGSSGNRRLRGHEGNGEHAVPPGVRCPGRTSFADTTRPRRPTLCCLERSPDPPAAVACGGSFALRPAAFRGAPCTAGHAESRDPHSPAHQMCRAMSVRRRFWEGEGPELFCRVTPRRRRRYVGLLEPKGI